MKTSLRLTIAIAMVLAGENLSRADELTVDQVTGAKGDGPDEQGNTADDTWGFWFEIAHARGEFHRLKTHSKSVDPQGVPRRVTGPIASMLPNPEQTQGWIYHRDWDGRFEGVWGDAEAGRVIAYPYVEKNAHLAVAITYTVPADGKYDIAGELADLQVAPQFKQHDGIEFRLDVAEAGKSVRLIGKGGPLGDGHGRPDTAAFKFEGIEANGGQLIRLAIQPRAWWGTDMTHVKGFTVTPSAGP